jgi:hypothetical protein
VDAYLPRFEAIIKTSGGAIDRQLTRAEAQKIASHMYQTVHEFAHEVAFEVQMAGAEDGIAKLLGARVLHQSDLRRVMGALEPMLRVLCAAPPETRAVRQAKRIARKHIFLATAHFFSEGVAVLGFFSFFSCVAVKFVFTIVARREFDAHATAVQIPKNTEHYRTVQSEIALETVGLSQDEMRFFFFGFFGFVFSCVFVRRLYFFKKIKNLIFLRIAL